MNVMKIQVYYIAVCILVVTLLFPAQTQAASTGANIEDPVLEQAIRDELKLSADQTLDFNTMEKLTSLFPQGKRKIKSLKGLEMAYNLTRLYLPNQEITDITPLSDLYQLDFLALNDNQITNICPISSLTRLQKLIISGNQIEDVSCFKQLTSLTDLLAGKNKIKDVTSLSKSKIKWLDVSGNMVSDISSTTTMKELRNLYVDQGNLNEKSKQLLEQLKQSGIAVNQNSKNVDNNSGITVLVNGDRVLFDQSPRVEEGTTLVQFRPLFEKLGFTIQWDDNTKTIQAHKEGVRLSLQVDNEHASLNGSPYVLPIAPINVEGNIFVPIRFVGEASKYEVTWEKSTKTIYLMTDHDVVSPDGKSQLKLSGKWFDKTPPSDELQIFTVSGDNTIMSITEPDADLSQFESLAVYEKSIIDSLESQIKDYSQGIEMKINGLDASQFSYTYISPKGTHYTYVQTLIKGKYSFFRVILLTTDKMNAEVNQEYQNILQSFQEIKTASQLNQEKISKLTPKEYVLDIAHFYRKLGFFQKDKSLSDQRFDDKFLEFYQGYANKDRDPFDTKKAFNEFADLYVLQQDKDRVWMENTEVEVGQGKDVYVQMLKEWSAISRGSFLPTGIVETWDADEESVALTFTLNGQKQTIHPAYTNDYIDTDILFELNEMMKETGHQFAEVYTDHGESFVTVLTEEEKAKMAQERFIDFYSYD
ncbi:hypothetical protein GK047_28860 [Paenibacillus sp. SYP-B3998]|uniref:Copper amine oxidase-like N-terminal domain-containing protein n=1 Tax=Paenibacillus sp. SYP-B3998 TaxID=2678564 RepID=A0A6G4A6F0_9BACL|nr:stalk domain-containing protein [Paenibacillus sp. SYP-B3998]NEW09900.1 hypothetical protein [Paenibacillus sp. SYP-B3998]